MEKQRSLVPKESVIEESEGSNRSTNKGYGNLVLSPVVLPPELPFVLDKEAVMDILGVSCFMSYNSLKNRWTKTHLKVV